RKVRRHLHQDSMHLQDNITTTMLGIEAMHENRLGAIRGSGAQNQLESS
ncbi:hypothetical protein AVDCRST_MAG81-5246, partial [uncultured Synechococcales cyanobacterium]